jgi:uncharacterized protein YdaU (DUF1376 family)
MDSKVDIWMPLAIGDYLADTSHLDTLEHGAYLLLLMHYWRKGPLPNDMTQLAHITKLSPDVWSMHQAVLLQFFIPGEDGLLHQKRQDIERAKASNRRQRGSQGAQAKWGIDRAANQTKITRSERLAEARKKGIHTKEEWLRLQTFCRHHCVRCQASDTPLMKDHIIPLYRGGSDSIENIQPLCKLCSSSKGSDTTDYRPDGWQNACKTPGKMSGQMLAQSLPNAWTLPSHIPSPSQSPLSTPEKQLPEFAKSANSSSNANASDASSNSKLAKTDGSFEFTLINEEIDLTIVNNASKRRAVEEVFAYYLEKTGRNRVTYPLTPLRQQKGRSRLDDALRMIKGNLTNAMTLMKAAIDELTLSDWHMGRNPETNGKRYCDWEKHLFGSTERFQRWLQQAEEAPEAKHA